MTILEILDEFNKRESERPEVKNEKLASEVMRKVTNGRWAITDKETQAELSRVQNFFNEKIPQLRELARTTEDALLALFTDLLKASDVSHITAGHPVSKNSFHVYRRVANSPTNCQLAFSFPKTEKFIEVFRASRRSTEIGGRRHESVY